MTDDELIAELNELGIDRTSYRVAALLPLIQVAWADGEIQDKERSSILEIAEGNGMLRGAGGDVVRGWLQERPTDQALARGRRVLVALVHRHRGIGEELSPDTLDAILGRCEDVARAAGGLFDVAFTVDARERAAIKEIAGAMSAESAKLLDELPSPDGGSFQDL